MVDYKFRAHIMELGYYAKAIELKSKYTRLYKSIETEEGIIAFNEFLSNEWIPFNSTREGKEALKMCEAWRARVRHLKKSIRAMLVAFKNCIFLTFTFTDDIFTTTSRETRRQYVRKFLKAYCKYYVCNIDFGEEKGREHYHAVCVPIDSKGVPFEVWNKVKNYGNLDGAFIHTSKDYIALAKYISKLTNHAIKETTQRNSIIYSRGLQDLACGYDENGEIFREVTYNKKSSKEIAYTVNTFNSLLSSLEDEERSIDNG